MRFIYAVMVLVLFSVVGAGQRRFDGDYGRIRALESDAETSALTVSKPMAIAAHAILDSGSSLTGEQLIALLTPVKSGERVALFAPENLRDLDGELRIALGVDTALRPCRADELSSGTITAKGPTETRPRELTAFIRPAHGGYCKAGSLTNVKGRHVKATLRKRGFTEIRSTDTDADITEDGVHWFHWAGPSCKYKLPAFNYTSLGPPGGTRGTSVTPAGLWAEPVKYAHAQQKPPAAILPTTEIKVPEKENALLRDRQAQIDKLRETYKISEYEKELKALAEVFESGRRALDVKYKVEGFQKEAGPIGQQMQTIAQYAVIVAQLTEEQKANYDLVKDEKSGDWLWRPRPKQ